jgi:uncharacterized membrane protein
MNQIFTIMLVVLFIDNIYLSLFHPYFKVVFKRIQGSPLVINMKGAFLSYLFIIFSIYYFLVIKSSSLLTMFLLGLFIYGIYEGTNLATFSNWPVYMVMFDTLWGGILYLLTSVIVKKIHSL